MFNLDIKYFKAVDMAGISGKGLVIAALGVFWVSETVSGIHQLPVGVVA